MSIAIPLYLAITPAEISRCGQLPEKPAYMACHFSAASVGLSNLPQQETPMLILDDSLPPSGHDPQIICTQLQQICGKFKVQYLLLDLQRPNDPETAQIVKAILDNKPCNTIVSEAYGKALACPLFLNSPLPHQALEEYIAPFKNRTLWLELAVETVSYRVSKTDCTVQSVPYTPAENHCKDLHCHYNWTVYKDHIDFTLSRDRQDCDSLLRDAQGLGISGFVGLYQQFP